MAYMTFYCNAVSLVYFTHQHVLPTVHSCWSRLNTYFTLNQAVAMLAVMVLLFAYFPPSGCSIKNGGEEVDEADV